MIERTGIPGVERVAAIAERLAVLLQAGVPPASAWRYIADQTVERERRVPRLAGRARFAPRVRDAVADVILQAADAARDGRDVASAIVAAASASPRTARTDDTVADAWRAVAAAWSVASHTGAPLAQSLHQLAGSQRALGQTQRDVAAALAGPRATSRLVMVLPFVGVLFGFALGFDTVHTMFATVPGAVCLAAGTLLMLFAWRWTSRLVKRAMPSDTAPGLSIELTAIAMASGSSIERARAAVEEALSRCDIERGSATDASAIDSVLSLARAAGIPAGALLRSEAAQARRNARSAAQLVSASLATRLMLPLGICILPAFMLVGVAPLMLSVLSSTMRAI